jgi:hypothetical protein
MKTAVIVAGVLRHCDVSSLSWKFPIDVDFYLSTWDLTEYVHNGNKFYSIEEELKHLEHIDFKHIHIENYKKFYQTYKTHIGFEMSRVFYLINKIYEQIKNLNYKRVIVIRPDLFLCFKDNHNFVKLIDSMEKNSAYTSSRTSNLDYSQKYSKEFLEEYIKNNKAEYRSVQFNDDHFIFEWSAFEKFAKIWPGILFDQGRCPHTHLFKFFLLEEQVRMQFTGTMTTNINRAPLKEYQQQSKPVDSFNINTVSNAYEQQCKLEIPNKNKTFTEIEEYFKNN